MVTVKQPGPVGETFLCPDCRRPLVSVKDAFRCPACQRAFPDSGPILSLLPGEIAAVTVEDVRAWDDDQSGRVEHQPPWLALVSKEAEIRYCQRLIKENFPAAPERIVEIGGGMCWGSMLIKYKFPGSYVVATDIAASALVRARCASAMANVAADRYIACDASRLPFPDDYFDVCFGSEVLHHLPDPVAGLKEVRRVLKPGGKYIGMGEGHTTLLIRLAMERLGLDRTGVETQKYRMQEKMYSIEQWQRYFNDAAFSRVKFKLNKDPSFQYSSRGRLAFFLFISLLPDWLVKATLGSAILIIAEK